jgi:hypothetical protein
MNDCRARALSDVGEGQQRSARNESGMKPMQYLERNKPQDNKASRFGGVFSADSGSWARFGAD